MDWANKNFAPEKEAEPSRLIVEVRILPTQPSPTISSKRITKPKATIWMPERQLISCASYSYCHGSRTVHQHSVILHPDAEHLPASPKNTVKLENLLLIGYSPYAGSHAFIIYMTVGLNVLVLLLAIGCVAWVRSYYIEVVQNLFPQLESGSLLPCILTGCLLFFAVSLLNIWQ